MIFLPTLETERLVLRPVTLKDADSVFTYASNPNVARYVTWEPHSSVKETEEIISNFFLENYKKNIPEPWAITFKDRREWVIGAIGCRYYDRDPECMELAYVLAEEHWGQGITTEAAKAVLPYIFEQYKPKTIVGRYVESNPASGRILEKLGMKFIESREEIKKGHLETMSFFGFELNELN